MVVGAEDSCRIGTGVSTDVIGSGLETVEDDRSIGVIDSGLDAGVDVR
jgi:hypothetical protein